MWVPAPFFMVGACLLFGIQFFVPRAWTWLAVLVANGVAWIALIFWFLSVDNGPSSIGNFLEGMVFFGLFGMTPFLLGSVLGTVFQKLVAAFFSKLRTSR